MTVLPAVCYFSAQQYCLGLLTFLPHCGDNVKVKTQHIISPSCSEAWVKQWLQMNGALFIAYDALRMKV